jgi:uncharacterized membrane protein YgcG
MHDRTITSPKRWTAHRGMATLEFVMALPFLLLLIVAITWLGFTVIAQTEVMIEARNKAWEQRFKNAADNPLSFPILPEHDLPLLPKYNADADYITEKVGKTVNISPMFKGVASPNGSHTILAGSWDYEAMPFTTPPDFKLMAKAALFGTFSNVLDLVSSADDPLGLLGKLKDVKRTGDQNQSQTEREKSQVGKDDGSGGGSGGTGASGEEKSPEEAKAQSEADLKKHKEELMQRFKALGGRIDLSSDTVWPVSGELEKADEAIRDAQEESRQKSEAARNEQDEEKKKLAQEESARARRKVELAQITKKRLEYEVIDIAKEAEALDIPRWQLNQLLGVGIFP